MISFICPFSPQFQFRLRRSIKHSRQFLTTVPKFVKNTLLHVLFSTPFSMSGNVFKHGLSCLRYYVKKCRKKLRRNARKRFGGITSNVVQKIYRSQYRKKNCNVLLHGWLRSTLKFTIYNLMGIRPLAHTLLAKFRKFNLRPVFLSFRTKLSAKMSGSVMKHILRLENANKTKPTSEKMIVLLHPQGFRYIPRKTY